MLNLKENHMTIKARFKVFSQLFNMTYENKEVHWMEVDLHPVYDRGNKGNEDWSRNTPSGRLRLVVTNSDSFDNFKVGDEVSLTIEKIDVDKIDKPA